MRKLILLVFASILFITPAFAQEDEIQEEKVKKSELIFKLEISPSSQLNLKGGLQSDAMIQDLNFDNPNEIQADKVGLNAAVEYYYYFIKYLGIGAGFKYQFRRYIEGFGDMNTSNFYIGLKPKVQLKPNAKGSKCDEYVYLILQGGYGFFNEDFEITGNGCKIPSDTEDALYYGAGIGFEIKNLVFEILFAVNEIKINGKGYMPDGVGTLHKVSGDLEGKYSTTNINIGYKFGF